MRGGRDSRPPETTSETPGRTVVQIWHHRERHRSGRRRERKPRSDGGCKLPPPFRWTVSARRGCKFGTPVNADGQHETPGRTVREIFRHRHQQTHRQAPPQRGRQICDPVDRSSAQVGRCLHIAATVTGATDREQRTASPRLGSSWCAWHSHARCLFSARHGRVSPDRCATLPTAKFGSP